MAVLYTKRLELIPVTLAVVEAVLKGDRKSAEELTGVSFPPAWPGRDLVERALPCPVENLRNDPESYLWGSRLLICKETKRFVVGSVVLNGRPSPDGTVEIGYGVEESWQGHGFATEGTQAVVDWALEQHAVSRVTATTFPWHIASLRVIQKVGMEPAGTRLHDMFGDLVVFEKRRCEGSS
jgi:[ribosomal protein S5]-alanine N-acetyltransferase